MKTVKYPLEELLQEATIKDKAMLVDSFKAILESNKSHYRISDVICYAISSIDTRVESIDEQLAHLINLKKRLINAKDVALEAGAIAFNDYGISKLDGSVFESITVSKPISKTKKRLVVVNEKALIDQGFFKYEKVLDTQKVIDEYLNGLYKEFIEQCIRVENVFENSKLIVNKRVAPYSFSSSNVASLSVVS